MMRKDISKSVINDIVIWIDNNVHRKLSIEKLSAVSGYSRWYFQRLFKKYAKTTPALYIQKRKVHLSLNDIKKTDIKIIDIVEKYGFSSQQSYNRIFKHEFGCTPKHCRKSFKIHDCTNTCRGICKQSDKT